MTKAGQHTYSEISTQTSAWAETLDRARVAGPIWAELWQSGNYDELLFTGCGSTYYLSQVAAAVAQSRGFAARAVPGSELWLRPRLVLQRPARTLLVTISRSGETSETVRATDAYRAAGGKALAAITCYPESVLARKADVALALPQAQEMSVAQTRSFACMLVGAQYLLAVMADDYAGCERMTALPALGQGVLANSEALAARLGSDLTLERFFFLGSGICHGLAQEAMLKMKEMSLSHSEAFHVLEFRHGPMSLVDERALVTCLVDDGAGDHEMMVVGEMKRLGGRVLAMTGNGAGAAGARLDAEIAVGSQLSLAERVVLYLPPLQLLAYYRAVAKGLDPDRPRHLTAAVVLP